MNYRELQTEGFLSMVNVEQLTGETRQATVIGVLWNDDDQPQEPLTVVVSFNETLSKGVRRDECFGLSDLHGYKKHKDFEIFVVPVEGRCNAIKLIQRYDG